MIKIKYLSYSLSLHLIIIAFLIFLTKIQIENSKYKYIEINLESFSSSINSSKGKRSPKKGGKKRTSTISSSRIKSFKAKKIKKNKLKPQQLKKRVKAIPDKTIPSNKDISKSIVSQDIEKSADIEKNIDIENNAEKIASDFENLGEKNKTEGNGTQNGTGGESEAGKGTGQDKKGENSGGSVGSKFLLEKFVIISRIVQKNIKYPFVARRMGWEGKVVISFLLTKDGKIKNLTIEKSSGYNILDQNALETVKRCAKYFPVPPVNIKIKLPVIYKLQ